MKQRIFAGIATISLISLGGVYGYNSIFKNEPKEKVYAQTITEQNNKPSQGAQTTTSYKNITQEEIHLKMLNTLDYFDSVKGSFEYKVDQPNLKDHIYVDYKVKTKNSAASYQKVTRYNGSDQDITELESSNNEIIEVNHKDKTIRHMKTSNAVVQKIDDKNNPKNRYKTDDKLGKIYINREDPTNMREASFSIFNQGVALGYLEDYSMWKIKEVTTFLGRQTIVLDGKFNNYYKQKFNSTNFELWVDAETGILTKDIEKDENGNIKMSLITEKIKFNDIKDDNFKIDEPTNYLNIE